MPDTDENRQFEVKKVKSTIPMDLKSTLNLPDKDFTIPMKADLPNLEPQIQAKWREIEIYHRIQESRADSPTFVLHDGPPYTNSPIHIGTATNKILKDFVVKSRTMLGFRAPYIPGYDNHGLPIEQTVMRAFHEKGEKPDVDTLRKACRDHAQKFIDVQSAQFQRLGVFGLWEKPYQTMDFRYEAEIVRTFKRLASEEHIYRGLRPVLWSPTSRTALADTEIEYKDYVSPSIYVRFPLIDDYNGWSEKRANVYAIIWTTTPWTIPANLAVAFHPAHEYALVSAGDCYYVVLNSLAEATMQRIGEDDWKIEAIFAGATFEKSKFNHPFYDRESLGVLGEYVTTEDGTGVVHTAPGHGRDDFFTGIKYSLGILCPVDESGVMTQAAPGFEGISYLECNARVIEKLQETGNLLHHEPYHHNYPHAERDGKPVIFRATEQWFVSIDANSLRERMLEEIDNAQWIPQSGHTRLRSMIANRPDWCISRQRPWGVGIPVFYGVPSGQPVLDPEAIECVAKLIEEKGSDAWFTEDPSTILPKDYAHPQTGETEFRKETDVLDVWFDSGATCLCVLEGNVYPEWTLPIPADLYLEGSDQHRGWFNTSLIVCSIARRQAPYKAVLTHGFLLDESGLKMSKRLMNALDPEIVCSQFGADILRYWVASVDYTSDVPCGESILKQFGEGYRRVRNTLRFLLANLDDFELNAVPELSELDAAYISGDDWNSMHEVLPIDLWAIEQTDLLVADCCDAYAAYDFNKVISGVHNFCVRQLSSFYLDAIKDRMYCDGKYWPSRRSGQIACHYILCRLNELLAPILPHTAEEVYARIPSLAKRASIHIEVFKRPTAERMEAIEGNDLQARFAELLSARDAINIEFEKWKETSTVKDSQDAVVTYGSSSNDIEKLKSFGEDLPTYLKFSEVKLVQDSNEITFAVSAYAKCERSRLRRADVTEVNGVPLSSRDRKVLGY